MSKLHKIVATTAFVGTVAVGGSQIADADTYTIKSGDTLWDIAVNNGTTVDALMQDNNLSSHLIYPGDKLNYSSSSSSSVEKLAQVKNDGYYTIALGDTLGTVADKFGTSVDNLVEINNLSNPHLVYVGQVIKVDGNAAPKATPAVAQAAPVQAAPVQAAPVARVQAAPVAQTRVAAPAAQTKAAAPAAQTPAPAAQTKAATPAPAAQTKPAATTTPSGSKNAAIYQAALAQVGRYQDCTMLVTNALKSVGINYHDWPAGYMKLGTQVSASQAQAGDLVYYANGGTGLAHIAVYAGNGQAVHGGWLGNQTVVNTANVGSGPVYIRVK